MIFDIKIAYGGKSIPVRRGGDNILQLLYTRSQASGGPSHEMRPPSRAVWNRVAPVGKERSEDHAV